MSEHFDIAVVGSGAAGIAAAVSAARAGRKTLLLDKNAGAGGTGGFSGLTTLCGLYDDAGNFLNDGLAREFAELLAEAPPIKAGRVWLLPYRPEKFRAVAEKLFADTPNLKAAWNMPLHRLEMVGNRIASLNDFEIGAVIDCSGDAEVGRASGAELMATDETTQAPAVVFALRDVAREINSPADAARVLLPVIRAGFAPLNFHFNLDPGSITAKFSGPPDQVPALIDFLKKNVAGFENCASSQIEFFISHRAGRMIVGLYVLMGADAWGAKKFPDAVARCAWPLEQWDHNGKSNLRWLPAGEHYDIPARSLRAANIENLFMAGKTMSADTDAMASARVMGCCLATGAAAGILAANYLNSQP